RQQVDSEWQQIRESELRLTEEHIRQVSDSFKIYRYRKLPVGDTGLERLLHGNPMFSSWYRQNTREHRQPGYRIVYVSLKAHGQPPGDINDEQMDHIADLADQFSLGEIRTTYTQNLVLAHVEQSQLYDLWRALGKIKLAMPNIGTVNDIICCPGSDFCSLANASSIDISSDIMNRFEALDRLYDIGDIRINISGCMNACGHHHVGHIGLLGVDKKGEDWYQITLGGSATNDTALGKVLGPAVIKAEIGRAVEQIIEVYVELRQPGESFLQTLDRVGRGPFKERIYATVN
ncbi:MAG: nitrite/sulfite reductase, partial [Gammaproteobacteria bacterium]|nr:nitrite/sulfite reductase [Gammaproteobacteria bacterium]